MAITVMKRYEQKYLMDARQTAFLRKSLEGHLVADEYGKTTIASIYYDTPSRRLVRTSLEKPLFKEKIRLRSYGRAKADSPVFLELKRKAYDVVYKRRIETTIPRVDSFFSQEDDLGAEGQVGKEIRSFRDYYEQLVPSCLIMYDRTAYYEPNGDLRLTIDEAPRYRMDDLVLTGPMEGELLLAEGWTILEVKIQDSMPLWLAAILSEGEIRKTSFSKYGEAFRRQLQKVN